jgi:acetolactate synthase-1/2/3 large subunit
MVKVADYVASFLESKGISHVFTVTGGGAMFLNDGLAKSKKIKGIFNHHEQACAMSALGYTKITNQISVVMPTTGCGGTNTITGLLDAWQDSNKVVFISGNVNKKETTYCSSIPLRKFGVQEANIVEIVKSITKYAVMITDPNSIAYHLEKAFYLCEEGRPGPVWIDIPLDVQGSYIDETSLEHFVEPEKLEDYKDYISTLETLLLNSKRPIVIAGYGIYLSDTKNQFRKFIEKYNLPVAFTYLGVDLLPSDHTLYVGRLGTKGDRAGNFAVQNSDLIISLGSSLSVSVTGFRYETFAREAKKIVVDIDPYEHKKNTINIDYEINLDLKKFFENTVNLNYFADQSWIETCNRWKNKWPVFNSEYENVSKGINIYYFLNELSKKNKKDSVVISDAGSAYYTTSQAIQISGNQRYVTSGAQADMGFTLPASIGAAIASNTDVVGITGDGSFQMNIQELQTIVNYNLPIKLFVLNNGGYLSIRNTMDKFFESRYYGTDSKSGLSFPEIKKIARAYGIPFYKLKTSNDLKNKLSTILNLSGPVLIEVMCPFKQDIVPSSSTKQNEDGKLVSQPLENMFPFLSEDEFKNEMIVKPLS